MVCLFGQCGVLSAILVCLLGTIIWFFYSIIRTWKDSGVPSSEQNLKTIYNVFARKMNFAQAMLEVYTEMKAKGAKFCGTFVPFPAFVPIDPEVIKNIMQKDFNYFVNRGVFYNEKHDPLSAHLFSIEDNKWRNLRAKLSPTFTSGKMKMMFNTILSTNKQMKLVLDEVKEGDPFEIKEIMSRLNTDIIGSCAFGIDCNSLKDPETPFRTAGKGLFENGFVDNIRIILSMAYPNIARKLGSYLNKPHVTKFFMGMLKDTVDYREKNNIYRKDFMHLLIQLKNRGLISDDEQIMPQQSDDVSDKSQKITFNELAAQAFVFFIAGFETSSSVISYALYELALHQEIQSKVRDEVNKVVAKHGNEITYEAIMDMTYMEMVANEALRKYPTLPLLNRQASSDYKIPGTDITLKKGTKVFIPTLALHHDPEYYPNPEEFIPERFTEENKSKRHPFTFLPFGEGPRICIGLRFGMIQTKVALAVLLQNYEISLDKQTTVPLLSDPTQFLNIPLGGIWVNIKHISK